jgi:hypothetical protein
MVWNAIAKRYECFHCRSTTHDTADCPPERDAKQREVDQARAELRASIALADRILARLGAR